MTSLPTRTALVRPPRQALAGRALAGTVGAAGVAGMDRLLEARARQALAAILGYLRAELRAGARAA